MIIIPSRSKTLFASILDSDDFDDNLYPTVKALLIELIENHNVGFVTTSGDSKNMIYRLFCELERKYPQVNFSILLINDKLAYEDDDELYSRIFRLDGDIIYKDPENAKKNCNDSIIRDTNIIICRKGSIYEDYHRMRSISKTLMNHLEIITI